MIKFRASDPIELSDGQVFEIKYSNDWAASNQILLNSVPITATYD